MKGIRGRIDQLFCQWAALVIRNKWVFAALLVALTGFMGSQLRFMKMDTSTEGFFRPDDPSILLYESFRDQFGRDEMVVLMIESDHIFSQDFLVKLKKLHMEIEDNVPNLKDINSLVSARKTVGAEGQLIVEDLLEELPSNEQQVSELKAYVMNNPLYKNFLIDESGTRTLVAIQTSAWSSEGQTGFDEGFDMGAEVVESTEPRTPITDKENSAIIQQVKEIKDRYQGPDFKISFTGSPVVTDFLKRSMMKDMRFFTLLAIGGIALFLGLMFRRFSGVLLPLLTVILSFVYTLGLMAMTGTALKLPTQIMPSFLLAVGIGASVHMMSMFYKDFHKEKGNKDKAIIDAIEHSGLPVLMTSLTTAAGLMSFASAEIAPVADLGIFAAFGVMVAFFMTVTLLPTFLAILPVRHQKHQDTEEENTITEKLLLAVGDFAHDRHKIVVGLWALALLVAAMGIPKLKLEHNVLIWFPEDSEIRLQTKAMDDYLKGSVSIELLVDTGKENGLYDPKILKGLDELEKFALAQPMKDWDGQFVGKAFSLASMVKEINQALGENRPENYSIPDDPQLIAQEFLLFENSGSDDLEDQVDSQFSKTRMTIKAPWVESRSYVPLLNSIEAKAHELLGPDVKIQSTGMIELFARTMDKLIQSMVSSYLIAGVVISLMMILLMGRVRLGLLSMIPNLTPIILTLGFMGYVGMPLDMFTLLIGSIAIGLAVDDTIHFFHNYQRYLEETGDSKLAIEHTLMTAGRAMVVTSTVLTLGFWLYMLATMNNLFNFGLLTGMTMILAFWADILLAPALLTWADQRAKK